ncbi:CoA-transferase subunit beta [Pseudofrankia inefficax]|uniref:Coenzyme A transferase n=1 Tax=Pseudofrankia inefficax (strain DSM 45817 / CECT 9037 / DDB 130130 / EuI1c) TaxID=298654 RepID=E3ITS5_PSEI1|nr:CoA-transferase [Pseudofrankia inefficax]ADP79972.1 coenzyme A transferase [Pseudofrankia inefficax]
MTQPEAAPARPMPAVGGPVARRADVCALACAEAFRGAGEILASAFGTAPALGARLARLLFAPDLVLSDGEAMLLANTPPLGAPPSEAVVEGWLPFRSVFDVVAAGRRHVIMIPSQLDAFGNMNISAVGPHARPKAQLIGTRGAPGNTVNHATSYWVPRHGPRVFVERVDVVCGVGYDRARAAGPSATRFHGLGRVVTDLAVLDFASPDNRLRLASVHPGVTVDEVLAATGFPLVLPAAGSDAVPVTPEPSAAELDLLDVLDPKGLRYREVAA